LRSQNGKPVLHASVIIPTYKRPASLIRTLIAIRNQEQVPDEVIVVDDCSPDDTYKILQELNPLDYPFKLCPIRQRKNLGPAAARNLGITNAKNDIILFTDDDCEPDRFWAVKMVEKLEKEPDLAGTGGPIVSARDADFDLFFDHYHLLDPKFDGPEQRPLYLVTANAAYRKSWLLKVGGFDESLRKAGGEDPGLSFKILSAGGCLGFVPDSVVYHHYPSKLISLFKMFWNYGYGGCHVASAYSNLE